MFRVDLSPMPASRLMEEASRLIEACRAASLRLATAESCTGGLIASALTEIPGASDVFERGFVTYSNNSKSAMLGVGDALIEDRGAVSAEVARAMAEGALSHSEADVAIAVTGIAGPDGGSANKPVGLVHIAAARTGAATLHIERRYGTLDRSVIRLMAARDALELARQAVDYADGIHSK